MEFGYLYYGTSSSIGVPCVFPVRLRREEPQQAQGAHGLQITDTSPIVVIQYS